MEIHPFTSPPWLRNLLILKPLVYARLSHSGLIPKNPKKIPALPDMRSQKFQRILILYDE